MRKIVSILLIATVIVALYHHQKPIVSTEEAIVHAYEHLKNHSSESEFDIQPIQVELNAIPVENISLTLRQQEGFLKGLFNQQQWEVTISYEDVIPTVIMDAVTGEVLGVTGPLN